MMRVLTVRQPWAWAIVHGHKDVENRSRNIAGSYRGPVAIHAGLQFDYDYSEKRAGVLVDRAITDSTRDVFLNDIYVVGNIVGVVDLVEAHHAGWCYDRSIRHAAQLYRDDRPAFDRLPITNGAGGLIGRASYCSPWAQDDAVHLVMANPRPLAEPLPWRGALGLRELPAGVEAEILGGLA